jgi:hypothetical protein
MSDVPKILRRKEFYSVGPELTGYLKETGRLYQGPAIYHDLHGYLDSYPLMDRRGKATLWQTLVFDRFRWKEIHPQLISIYMALRSGGDEEAAPHLYVDRVDYCEFGNSKPFRIRVVNQFNDNYDHYYIKIADTSRIHGLELEHILSPNRIHYLVNDNTLIEEHIAGIPGDVFLGEYVLQHDVNRVRLAKEFVKFDERCFIRLLGDMRSYNYVVDITLDFEDEQYRVRAIDFDQQSYEGDLAIYRPRSFKENETAIGLVEKYLNQPTRRQYRLEERNLIAKRLPVARRRLDHLLEVMRTEPAAPEEHVARLRDQLGAYHQTERFRPCRTMGELVGCHLSYVMEELRE